MAGVAEKPAPAIRALLVEDDVKLARVTAEYLQGHGVRVVTSPNGAAALEEVRLSRFDVVLLDLMLPGRSGLEVCRELRARSDIPILILTARGEEADRVLGLELGADDYLTKPFSPRELLARIQSHVRRSRGLSGPSARPLTLGGLVLDPASLRATLDGRELPLTAYEFQLLLRARRARRTGTLARAAAGAGSRQRRGGLRPLDRRPHLAAAGQAGRRSQAAAVAQDGARSGLRARRSRARRLRPTP